MKKLLEEQKQFSEILSEGVVSNKLLAKSDKLRQKSLSVGVKKIKHGKDVYTMEYKRGRSGNLGWTVLDNDGEVVVEISIIPFNKAKSYLMDYLSN